MDYNRKSLIQRWIWGLLLMIWISVFLGFFNTKATIYSGVIGFETNLFLQDYVGFIGAVFILAFILIAYLVVRIQMTPEKVGQFFKSSKEDILDDFAAEDSSTVATPQEPEPEQPEVVDVPVA